MTMKTANRTFYEDQVRYCDTKDIAGIRSHYTDDAVLVSFDNQISGVMPSPSTSLDTGIGWPG